MAGEIGDYCGIDFIGGGLGAVDKIDGSVLQDKDHFLVVTPTLFAPLSLDADSGLGENSPQSIAPNTNPGNKRWILVKGVFKGLTLYDNVTLDKVSADAFMDLTTTGAGNYYAYFRAVSDDCHITMGACDDGYSDVATYAGNGIIQVSGGDLVLAPYTANMDVKIYAGGRTASELRIIVKGNTGKVGAGIAEPLGRFHVHEPTAAVLSYITTDGNADASLWFGTDINGDGDGTKWAHIYFHQDTCTLRIGNSGAAAGDKHIVITTAGKVGVNDFEPGSQFDVDGDINTTVNYKVDDVQVVSNQGAVVANAVDPATTMARLNDLLARCRAHGLIAT